MRVRSGVGAVGADWNAVLVTEVVGDVLGVAAKNRARSTVRDLAEFVRAHDFDSAPAGFETAPSLNDPGAPGAIQRSTAV